MVVKKRKNVDPAADPFRERLAPRYRERLRLFGAEFQLESDHGALLRLARIAYADLPRHRLWPTMPRIRVRLQLSTQESGDWGSEPPPMQMVGGVGLLCGAMDAANFAVLCPETRRGLVSISRRLLEFPYYARYELLEFAVFTLANRALGFTPLHAACVGARNRGLLLIGESGAGKSTLALHCLMRGLDFLTEDATFVAPNSVLATGVANFLHVRENSLRFIDEPSVLARIRKSPVIRRRSGVKKYEVDLRRTGYRLAPAPLTLCGVVFVSNQRAIGRTLLAPLSKSKLLMGLRASQPYAVNQPNWTRFEKNISALRSYELRRGEHPRAAVDALQDILQ